MAQNISTYVISPCATLTLGPTASAWVDIRLSDIADMRWFLAQTWPAGTSSTTGLAVNLYPGWGGADPAENKFDPVPHVVSNPSSSPKSTVPQFSNNFVTVTQANGYVAINQPPAGQSTGQYTLTSWYLNTILNTWPNWVRAEIYSLDPVKTSQIALLVDL